jgi:hypothetical protein
MLMAARGPSSFCLGIAAVDAAGKYLNLNTICHSIDLNSECGIPSARYIGLAFTTFDVDEAMVEWLKTHVSCHGEGQA